MSFFFFIYAALHLLVWDRFKKMNVKKLYNLLRSFAFFIVNFPKEDEAVNKKIHFKYIYIATVKFATQFKAGVMKAVFWLVITVLT